MRKIIVRTSRLYIVPQSPEELNSLHDGEIDEELKQAYREMMETMRQLPGREEWGTNWMICLSSGQTIGGFCFKGAPDAGGSVEIGYGIDEAYRQKGYATEAVKGMVGWALGQNNVRQVVAQTEADNEVSRKVLLNNGFVRDGYGEEGPLYKISL